MLVIQNKKMLDKNFKLKKNERKIKSSYSIKSPKNTNKLTLNTKPLSISDLLSFSPLGKNKTKTMLENLLSTSKGIMMNRKKYKTSTNFPKRFKHFYPFRPNNSQILNFSHNEEKTKLILSPLMNESARNINGNSSPKNTLSTIRPFSSRNRENNYNYYKLRNYQIHTNRDSYIKSKYLYYYKIKNNLEDKKNNSNSNTDESKESKDNNSINNNEYLDENKFNHFIDEMNKNNNYISKCKNKIKDYFITESKENWNKSFFEELLYKYKFDEQGHRNFFLNDIYSVKKNSFNIGDLKICLKLSSLQFIFYEITDKLKEKKN